MATANQATTTDEFTPGQWLRHWRALGIRPGREQRHSHTAALGWAPNEDEMMHADRLNEIRTASYFLLKDAGDDGKRAYDHRTELLAEVDSLQRKLVEAHAELVSERTARAEADAEVKRLRSILGVAQDNLKKLREAQP